MPAPSLAWGELHLFQLPDDSHLYGREFELLPTGSMHASRTIMHGICGIAAEVGADNVARVAADDPPEVYAIRDTDHHELGVYEADVVEGFRLRQLQDAQG